METILGYWPDDNGAMQPISEGDALYAMFEGERVLVLIAPEDSHLLWQKHGLDWISPDQTVIRTH